MLDTRALVVADRAPVALLYLAGTLLIGLVAVWLGILVGRLAAAVSRTRTARQEGGS
jgi:CrcB protein